MATSQTSRAQWQQELAAAVRAPAELLADLGLPESLVEGANAATADFRLMVTRSFVERMEPGNPHDPLLRQVLPVAEETVVREGFVADPLQEAAARQAPGLVQKYRGRVLLIAAGSCAINCRYCFRREYPYEAEPRRLEDWLPAISAIADDETIHEVILSGGDPLILSDTRIDALLSELEAIPHLTNVRIHSRLPIVLPSRVTDGLVRRLLDSRLQPVTVVHSNHPNEVVATCRDALAKLVRSGVPTLNQTVLLRSINDDPTVLIELSRRLTAIGVMPYYLHRLDRVTGTAHFEVAEERGYELVAEMRRHLPGYAVPRLVVEEPGEEHKTVLA